MHKIDDFFSAAGENFGVCGAPNARKLCFNTIPALKTDENPPKFSACGGHLGKTLRNTGINYNDYSRRRREKNGVYRVYIGCICTNLRKKGVYAQNGICTSEKWIYTLVLLGRTV